MGALDKVAGAVVAAVGSLGGLMDIHSMSTKADYNTQQSSHYEQRADDRSRRRTRTVQSSTRNAGNRKRGSGKGGEKPAHLDHRYNG